MFRFSWSRVSEYVIKKVWCFFYHFGRFAYIGARQCWNIKFKKSLIIAFDRELIRTRFKSPIRNHVLSVVLDLARKLLKYDLNSSVFSTARRHLVLVRTFLDFLLIIYMEKDSVPPLFVMWNVIDFWRNNTISPALTFFCTWWIIWKYIKIMIYWFVWAPGFCTT